MSASDERVAQSRRVALSDDGKAIRLTIYVASEHRAAVTLDAMRALGLAQQLIAAALPRLSNAAAAPSHSSGEQHEPLAAIPGDATG